MVYGLLTLQISAGTCNWVVFLLLTSDIGAKTSSVVEGGFRIQAESDHVALIQGTSCALCNLSNKICLSQHNADGLEGAALTKSRGCYRSKVGCSCV